MIYLIDITNAVKYVMKLALVQLNSLIRASRTARTKRVSSNGAHDHTFGKGIMTTVPAWCVSAHASFVFKIDSQKNQCLLIALNKMQLLKKIRLYVEVIF